MSLYVLEGLRPWVIQRVSAVYIAFFILYACFSFFTADVITYGAWKNWLYNPLNTTVGWHFRHRVAISCLDRYA